MRYCLVTVYPFAVGWQGGIKIKEDVKKGLRSCPIMLNAGRGDFKEAEPGAN